MVFADDYQQIPRSCDACGSFSNTVTALCLIPAGILIASVVEDSGAVDFATLVGMRNRGIAATRMPLGFTCQCSPLSACAGRCIEQHAIHPGQAYSEFVRVAYCSFDPLDSALFFSCHFRTLSPLLLRFVHSFLPLLGCEA